MTMFDDTATVAQSTSSETPFARRGWGLFAATVVSVVAIVGAPSAAHADDYTQSDPAPPASSAPERTFGFGGAMGGGVTAAHAVSSTGGEASFVGPALLLPTMELQFFFPREYSLDVVVPLTNIIVASKALDGFAFTADALFNANIGQGTARFVVGPGLGIAVLSSDRGSASTIRLPAQLGLEVLTNGRGFGFKLLARPWAEFAFADGATATGGGIVGAIAFSGYATRSKAQATASR